MSAGFEVLLTRRRSSGLRCAYCHDGVADDLLACERCRTLAHAACANETGGACPSLGCGGRLVAEVELPRDDEPGEIRWRLLAVLASALVLALAALAFFTVTATGVSLRRRIEIRSCEPLLVAYARAIREGKLAPLTPHGSAYPVPDLPCYGPPVEAVTVDRNGNVYFVTATDAFLDDGFVLRNGDAAILGRGLEPHVQVSHLSGDWWEFSD